MLIELGRSDLRAVASYAAENARSALTIFERSYHGDTRPRTAIDLAEAFARGGERTKAIRDAAWAAMRASHDARDEGQVAAVEAARAAIAAASACYLHPLAKATQVKHILGSAAHAALALELATGEAGVAAKQIALAARLASPLVIDVLCRYPPAPAGGGRAGALMRLLDASLRLSG